MMEEAISSVLKFESMDVYLIYILLHAVMWRSLFVSNIHNRVIRGIKLMVLFLAWVLKNIILSAEVCIVFSGESDSNFQLQL